MRKAFTGILLFVTSYTLFISCIYDFNQAKTYYSLWNPDKYFVKDTLIYDRAEDSDSEMSSPNTYYYGQLQKNKINGRVLSRNGGFIDSKVPIWFCILSKQIYYDHGTGIDNPISFNFLNECFNTFLSFIWLPNLSYFIYLRTTRKKLKELLLGIVGLYFVFIIYEIVTDFTVIKSIYSYF